MTMRRDTIPHFGGMNTRNDPQQLETSRAASVRNADLSRQMLEPRRGYKKGSSMPVWNRSTELRGLQTGILASRVPANLSQLWNDSAGASTTKVTLQVRVQGVDLSQVGESEVPYSLDYNGGHERPAEVLVPIASGSGLCGAYDIYKRTTEAMGFESGDSRLWKPTASNRYDTTASKMFPWVPGNVAAVSVADAAKSRPKMACVLGTGPLREFPLWHRNNSQKSWDGAIGSDWLNSYFTDAFPELGTNLRFPAPFAVAGSSPTGGNNVLGGYADAGDLYIFYVYSPFTLQWHLMALWEYSDPGTDATTNFNPNGMNRMFAFAGWGVAATNQLAAAIDPTQPHTVTISLSRVFFSGAPSRMEIGVDGDAALYGETSAIPKPGAGHLGASAAAPFFGLRELSGLVGVAGYDNKPEWRGRTMYLGGLPKMTNQRGVYGYGCGRSVQPGGTIGVTCPFPGTYSELRLFAGVFHYTGAGDAGSTPDDAGTLAAMSGLAPHDSRTVKRKAGGAVWDHATSPATTKYTGTVNIWRLDAESGDLFDPLYLLLGTGAETGFFTGGLSANANFVQDFHPFEPIGNGTLIAPGGLGSSSGAMRFNGGSPAFTLSAAKLRRDRGDVSQTADGEQRTSFGRLQPPLEEAFLLIYTPVTAPETEPASIAGSGSLDVPNPFIESPQQGEVHTLLQVMSPNREGKTTTTWGSTSYGVDPLGFTQGIAQQFDHPDSVWTGADPNGGSPDCGYEQKPPGRKDLELARIDLVAHKVSKAPATPGTPTELELERRYIIRADFGYGATFDDYMGDPSSAADKGVARQQRGNERFFRRNASKVPGSVSDDVPYDSDDDYNFIEFTGDNAYCYVTLCNAAGVIYTKPKDIEGRSFAVLAGYSLIGQNADTSAQVVGKQTLRVFDVTDPSNIFECIPTTAAASQRTADCGLSWAASELFGVGKYVLSLGGKLQPQGGEWWLGTSVYPSPIDPDAYPYGCWPLGTNPDTVTDPRSLAAGSGMVCNGAKGEIVGAFEFSLNIGVDVATSFLSELLTDASPWQGLVPKSAQVVAGNALRSAWLCDVDGGLIVNDAIGSLSIGLDDVIPLEVTTGKTQSASFANILGGQSNVVVHKNIPYTYNKSVTGRNFPDRIRPVRFVNTGRRDSMYGDDDFTTALLTTIAGHGETANVQPSRETLLAVLSHTSRRGQTAVLVVSKTAVLEYDKAGSGDLRRVFSLPQHFTSAAPVSRDFVGGRTVALSPSAEPVLIDRDGKPAGSDFIDPPLYAVPVVWARDMTTAELTAAVTAFGGEGYKYIPFEYPVAYETVYPKSRSVLGIERIDAPNGLLWTGEMSAPSESTPTPGAPSFSIGVGPELIGWFFFFTYYAESIDSESLPGRVFTWANGAPHRVPTYGVSTVASNPDSAYTGEPGVTGSVLVMRGSNPPELPASLALGEPKSYNLRIHNFPVPADPRVTHVRVYRSTANGGVPFLESEIPVGSGDLAKGAKATLLVGVKQDVELTQPYVGGLGSRVPPGARFMATYQGRTYYAGFVDNPQRVVASIQGKPTSVPFFYYVDLGGAGPAPVTGLFVDADRLYAFTENGVYVGISREWDVYDLSQAARGLPFSFELTQLASGAVADRAVCSVIDKGIFFAGDSSVYLMSGMQQVRASASIDGVNSLDLDTSKNSDALDQSRIVYPFAFDNDNRDRWRAVYFHPLRAVILVGGDAAAQKPCLVFFTDAMEWSFWTDYSFDDMEAVARFESEVRELWAVRDSRLWKLEEGRADGLDYFNADLTGQAFVNGATRLTTGTISTIATIFNTNDDLKLSLLTASLPAAYQAILATSTTQRRGLDLLRDAYCTVVETATGLSRFRRRIKFAYSDGTNVHVVLESSGSPAPQVGDTFRLGTIDGHWYSGAMTPSEGDELVELVTLRLQRGAAGVVLGSSTFRGDLSLYFGYDQPWPTTLKDTLPAAATERARIGGFRGRGSLFTLGLVWRGAYGPFALTKGSMDVNSVGGQGAYGS